MEPEEYYDSLDEESNYESIDNGPFDSNTNVPNLESDNPTGKLCENKEVQVKPPVDLAEAEGLFLPLDALEEKDDVIPFYGKDLSKVDVVNEECKNRATKRRPWRRKSMIPVGKLKSKSYLDMFHEKIGVEVNKPKALDDTSRATASDLTPRCLALENSARSSTLSKECSGSDSFYEGSFSKREYSLSLASFDSKFCSVSQQNMGVLKSLPSKRKYSKPAITKIPELGGLGPEIRIEKLEILKRRQLYGQKVSENNKIKMQERKLLQNLQQEIKRCNNI